MLRKMHDLRWENTLRTRCVDKSRTVFSASGVVFRWWEKGLGHGIGAAQRKPAESFAWPVWPRWSSQNKGVGCARVLRARVRGGARAYDLCNRGPCGPHHR